MVAFLALLPNYLFFNMWLPPCIAITHQLVTLRMRALASASLFFILNLIGLGLGPQVVGIINDLLEPRLGAEAVRYSLLLIVASSLSATLLFILAARHLPGDLARANPRGGSLPPSA
jgi:glucose-6-phosphate-specific signal transduction histidine kinase